MEKDGHKFYEAGDKTQCNEKSGIFFLLLALSYSNKLMSSLAGIVCTPTQFSMDCTGIDKKLVMFDDMSRAVQEGKRCVHVPVRRYAVVERFEKAQVHLIHQRVVKTYGERLSKFETLKGLDDAYPIGQHILVS